MSDTESPALESDFHSIFRRNLSVSLNDNLIFIQSKNYRWYCTCLEATLFIEWYLNIYSTENLRFREKFWHHSDSGKIWPINLFYIAFLKTSKHFATSIFTLSIRKINIVLNAICLKYLSFYRFFTVLKILLKSK